MRIPAEILTPYLSEIAGKPATDNRRPEPVGESSNVRGMPSSAESSRSSVPPAEELMVADRRHRTEEQSGKQSPAEASANTPVEERREQNRRKQARPAYLDTRSSKNRRRSSSIPEIDTET